MKLIRSLVIGLTIYAAALSAAEAHDSFNIGINVGGYGYNAYPAVTYRAVPDVVYYQAPRVYYPAAYAYYDAPVVVRRDYDDGPRYRYDDRRYHEGHRYYEGREHHGHHGWHR